MKDIRETYEDYQDQGLDPQTAMKLALSEKQEENRYELRSMRERKEN